MFRRLLVVLYATIAFLTFPMVGEAVTSYDLAVSVNQLRYERGLPYLAGDWTLDVYAQAHAEAMAASQNLAHSDIATLLGTWTRVGENVGVGDSIWHLLQAFTASPTHADNLYGEWTHVGVGLAVDGTGRLWVTIVVAS